MDDKKSGGGSQWVPIALTILKFLYDLIKDKIWRKKDDDK